MAEIGRFAKALQEHLDRNYKELQDTIEYRKAEEKRTSWRPWSERRS